MYNKITINNAKSIAISRGGECLSDVYYDAHSKLLWKCALGHNWYSGFNNIKRGTWCPKCSSIRTAQKLKLSIKDAINLARL